MSESVAAPEQAQASAYGARQAAPVAAATLAGAALLALGEAAGTRFVALALGLATVVLAWGWPELTRSAGPRGSRVAIAAGGLGMAVVVAGAPSAESALRALPVIAAGALILAFFGQLLRGDGRDRVVASLTGDAAALGLLVSGMTLPPLVLLRGEDRPIALAMAGVALALLADLVPTRWRGLGLLAAAALGAVGGMVGALIAPTAATAAVAALIGGSAGLVAAAARISLRELPGGTAAGLAPVLAAASLLAPGACAYTAARLFLG